MHRLVLFVLPLVALLGLSFTGTAEAATAKTYTVTRTAGPFNGAAKIGHFGFFRPAAEARLWPLVAAWMADRCGAPATSPHQEQDAMEGKQ